MTSSPVPQHPILRSIEVIGSALKDTADVDPTFMKTADKAAALKELSVQASQLEGLRMRLMASSQDVADRDAVRSVAGWLESRTLTEHAPNLRSLRLAQALDRRWLQLGAALTDGRANLAQVEVIARALGELPDDVPAETLQKAEAHLVE